MLRSTLLPVFLGILVLAGTTEGATYYVPDNYATIQAAINASANGDVIIVRPGTYMENIDFDGKEVTVQSQTRPEVTIIDGQQDVVVKFWKGEGPGAVLDGFTITNGHNNNFGGGITITNVSTPLVKGNIVTGNYAREGGGIYCGGLGSDATIYDNVITANTTLNGAGGIYVRNCSPRIEGNIINGNSGQNGGGIICYDDAHATIEGNIIRNNIATPGTGGGIYCWAGSQAVISGNVIGNNQCGTYGGGINISSAEAKILGNVISHNSAGLSGGGLYVRRCSPDVTNNLICGNTSSGEGGGIRCYDLCLSVLTNNTVAGNSAGTNGGGLTSSYSSDITIENSIFWNNSAPAGKELFLGAYGSIVTIGFSDVEGGQTSVYVEPNATLNWGTGMIDADPLFIEAAHDDYHLSATSPCTDTGNAISPNLPPGDFEGDPRPAGNAPDIGADEFFTHLYITVYTPAGGGVVPGAAGAVKVIGPPNEPVLIVMGRSVMDPPKQTPYGLYYLTPKLFFVDSGTIPADGVAVFYKTAPANWWTGNTWPFQAIIGWGGAGPALTNVVVLQVE